MKKLFSLFLVTALLLLALPTVCVSAKKAPTIVVNSVNADAGETIKITISVENNPGIICLQLNVGYDSNALKFEGAKEADFKNLTFGPTTKNPFIVTWSDPLAAKNNTTNGVFATLEFTVLDTAIEGKSEIALSYEEDNVFDIGLENVTFNVQNGYVDIKNKNPDKQPSDSSKPTASSQVDTSSKEDTSSKVDTSSEIIGDNQADVPSDEQVSNNSSDQTKDDTTVSDTTSADTTIDTDNNDSQNGWILWVVIAAIAVLSAAFIIVIVKSKKK